MSIESDPQPLNGQRLNAGKMIMGKTNDGSRNSFDIETCTDIDRKI